MATIPLGEIRANVRSEHKRWTRPRQVVLDILMQAQEHLTPYQVYTLARRHRRPLGLTTVYRTLELLSEMGLVRRIHLDSGCHSYALTQNTALAQLVCTQCGSTQQIEENELTAFLESIRAKTGFQVTVPFDWRGCCAVCVAQ